MHDVAGPERREQLERERDRGVRGDRAAAGHDQRAGDRDQRGVLAGLPAPRRGAAPPRGSEQPNVEARRRGERAARRQVRGRAFEIAVGERPRVVVQVHDAQGVARRRHRHAGDREHRVVEPAGQAERGVHQLVGEHEHREVEPDRGDRHERARRDEHRDRATGDSNGVMGEGGAMNAVGAVSHAGRSCERDAAAKSPPFRQVARRGVHGVDSVTVHAVDTAGATPVEPPPPTPMGTVAAPAPGHHRHPRGLSSIYQPARGLLCHRSMIWRDRPRTCEATGIVTARCTSPRGASR